MDFDLASKHKREVEQRRKEAKRKLEQQKKDEELKAVMEQEQRARELDRLKEAELQREQADREAQVNAGVRFTTRLRPYPSSRTDDKLELPPSALQELERQGAFSGEGTLLTFSVAVPAAPGQSAGPGRTHAGVAEFIAEEGSVGIPPRVALCLTKGFGVDTLGAVGQVEVRYVRLPRCPKSRVKFQPRGEGFHAGGLKSAHIDLQHVLEETLRGHTALTEGDWLPIRHAGFTYELVVRELEPEPHISLIDTELSVEVLPSEQTEAQQVAEEEKRLVAEAKAQELLRKEQLRLERCRQRALDLPPEPDLGPQVVQLLLRLPDGSRLTRRFLSTAPLSQVLTWVESEPSAMVSADEFRLVQKWPGHCRELGPEEAAQTLRALKFARQEALFLQRLGVELTEGVLPQVTEDSSATSTRLSPAPDAGSGGRASAWTAAVQRAHAALDRRLEGEEASPTSDPDAEPALATVNGQELVTVFERLRALGMEPQKAASASKRFAAQLKELGEMGFENWVEAVTLLERYNGRLLRVANLLSEQVGDFTVQDSPTGASPASQPVQTIQGDSTSSSQPGVSRNVPTELIKAKFQELIAAGCAPNEAAARAIQLAKEEASDQAQEAKPEVAAQHSPAVAEDKLAQLAAMGFVDKDRNTVLLQKYAGRLDRVIEALCS